MSSSTRPIAPQTGDVIANKYAAQVLGKALFWDIQAGSDGMACASCHFAAGADIRRANQVNPGFDDIFGMLPGGRKAGPNAVLSAADFPLYRLSDMNNRESTVLFSTNDAVSSSGTFAGEFIGLNAAKDYYNDSDSCDTVYDKSNPFHTNNKINRKVEPRQTPTVINAAFNLRQFWDGRANKAFNGVDPFGRRTNLADRASGVLAYSGAGLPTLQKLELDFSSMASQAVGPPLSSFEMSCAHRKFADIGRKLLGVRPLAGQTVSPTDSLFGPVGGLIAPAPARGLAPSYADIVRLAFNSRYWSASGRYAVDGNGVVKADDKGYSQMEQNFALFFGLALQEYQHMLISGNSRFDKGTLTTSETNGKSLFTGKGKCVNCHKGPLLTGAAFTSADTPKVVEYMVMGDGGKALYDNAFYNIGVRPTSEDRGVGGLDPYGNPLSFSLQYKARLQGQPTVDSFSVDPCRFEIPFFSTSCSKLPSAAEASRLRVAVDGAFKVPTLRNVGLTPPYMHNGSLGTLEQVVDFYNRGGNARKGGVCSGGDTTGFGANCSNRDADIQPLKLSAGEKYDLVAFLKSLTDDRVACQSGPFDHPELAIFQGHGTDSLLAKLDDNTVYWPATGAAGLSALGKPCLSNAGSFGEAQLAFDKIATPKPVAYTVRTLTGTAGNDTLTGQSGADVFKVSAGSDTFVAFAGGEDKIDFKGTGIKSTAQLTITVDANGMLVKLPNGAQFLLKGIDWSMITENDVTWDV